MTVSDNGNVIIYSVLLIADNHRIIIIGMWVGHEKHCTRNTLKFKRSKVKVKMVMRRSSTKRLNMSRKRHSVVKIHLERMERLNL